MLSGKFLFTLVGLLLAIFALCKLDFGGQPTVEGYWGGLQLGKTAYPVAKINGRTTAIGGNFRAPNFGTGFKPDNNGHSKFVQVPHFQSLLSPRMSGGVDYGAYIRYNTPDYQNLGVPCDPLTFGDMAKENFVPPSSGQARENYANCGGGCGPGGCGPSCAPGGLSKWNKQVAGGYELPEGPGVLSADPGSNYNAMWAKLRAESKEPDIVHELPIGTMTTMSEDGRFSQPVVYDRLMYASRPKSRLSGLGDLVRGDLAIIPCQGGWFSVYPNINIDLQEGYLGVAGGAKAANQDLVNLIVAASGGSQSTISGLNMEDPVNMTNETAQSIAALTDVYTTNFP